MRPTLPYRLRSSLGLCLVLWLSGSSLVRAQHATSPTAVVLSSTPEGLALGEREARRIEAALREQGVVLLSAEQAQARLLLRSRPPTALNVTDLDLLAQDARQALEHVAFGRSAAAKRSVEEILRRAERALESLNRDTRNARHVLDACLALVRNELARGDRSRALAEATHCRRLVPDVAPSTSLHPPAVVAVLAEADKQLRHRQIGRLSVESSPESGCATYVNGRLLGVTPFTLERAAEGAYLVQVECSRAPGRVHTVTLGDQPVDLHIDSVLDGALRDDGQLTLIYGSDAQEQELAVHHAAELGQDLGVARVILISAHEAGLTLTQIETAFGGVTGRVAGSARADMSPDREITRLLRELASGRVDAVPTGDAALVTMPEPPPTVVTTPVEAHPHRNRGTRRRDARLFLRAASASTFALGLGLFAAGSAFERKQRGTERALDALDVEQPESRAELERLGARYRHEGALRWIGLGGSALLTAAIPLADVDVRTGVPWWSYALGAVGAGLASWGARELARDNRCRARDASDTCAHFEETSGRGGLILAGAVPLLAVPITHLCTWQLNRRADRPSTVVGVVPRAAGALVTLRKELNTW